MRGAFRIRKMRKKNAERTSTFSKQFSIFFRSQNYLTFESLLNFRSFGVRRKSPPHCTCLNPNRTFFVKKFSSFLSNLRLKNSHMLRKKSLGPNRMFYQKKKVTSPPQDRSKSIVVF